MLKIFCKTFFIVLIVRAYFRKINFCSSRRLRNKNFQIYEIHRWTHYSGATKNWQEAKASGAETVTWKRTEKIIGFLQLEESSSQTRLTSSNDSMGIHACSSRVTEEEEGESDSGNLSCATLFVTLCIQAFLYRLHCWEFTQATRMHSTYLLQSIFTQEKLAGPLLFKLKKSVSHWHNCLGAN